jgi:hypothetical protein
MEKSINQGHIPAAACRRQRVRRIQPSRYVQYALNWLENMKKLKMDLKNIK